MTQFAELRLHGWRQFSKVEVVFDSPLTVITGPNGCGKTTILNVLGRHFGWNIQFLDPYIDPVEDLIEHHEPFVAFRIGSQRAEVAVKKLQFAHASRLQLMLRKIERLEDFQNLIARYEAEANPVLKQLLKRDIEERVGRLYEYSAMRKAVATAKGL